MLQIGQRKGLSRVFLDQDAWSVPAECAGSRSLARLKQKGNSERKHTHTNSLCLYEYSGPGILVCESVMTGSALKVVWKSQTIFQSVPFVPGEITMNGILQIKALTQIHYGNPLLESENFTKKNSSSRQEHIVFPNIMSEWSCVYLNLQRTCHLRSGAGVRVPDRKEIKTKLTR